MSSKLEKKVFAILPTPDFASTDSLNFASKPSDRIDNQGIALSGVVGFFLAWFIISRLAFPLVWQILIFLGCTAFPMVVLSILANRTHLRPTSGLLATPRPVNWRRYSTKLLALFATLAMFAFAYWLFPEYQKDVYAVVWGAAGVAGLPILAMTIAYFFWADRRMAQPEDGYWHFGLVLLGKWKQADRKILHEYALCWVIKGFFLPFMLSGAGEHIGELLKEGWNPATFATLYITTLVLLLTIDTLFGAVGYILTVRALDAQVRSPQPTWMGWVVTIICYAPFAQLLHRAFLKYKGDIDWSNWLFGHPVLFVSWGLAILILTALYVWSTISFGCRFSNLTNRGIIVDGPYAFMKHPAYFFKNLSWWLMAIPFAAHGNILLNIKACLLLGLTNFIYYLRAKTEEAHLSDDPAYRLYSDWIDHHGWGSGIKRWWKAKKGAVTPSPPVAE